MPPATGNWTDVVNANGTSLVGGKQPTCPEPTVDEPTVDVRAASLTTLFASNNSFAGNTFDLVAANQLTITGFAVNLNNPGSTNTISIYYRMGTADGNQNSSVGWILLGTDTNVVSNGQDVPTPVNIGGLQL